MQTKISIRMKTFYERVTRIFLPRRAYTIIRVDGKAFHTYTRGLEQPFDIDFVDDMDATAKYLCEHIQGAKCAFVQSDEISILLTDFDKLTTSAWFDNNLQKMCSISASLATAAFNHLRANRYWDVSSANINTIGEHFDPRVDLEDTSISVNSLFAYVPKQPKIALFDSRVFQIPSKSEVMNYFIWRQRDTVKNSISSVAQTLYSSNELHRKNDNEQQEMIFQKGINWNDYDPKLKRGRMIIKEVYTKNDETKSTRTRWKSIAPPTFTQDVTFLDALIPTHV